MSDDLKHIEVTPRTCGLDMAHCLMFYEYSRSLDAEWLDAVESLFAAFDEVPSSVTGGVGDQELRGRYVRSKPKLIDLLEARPPEAMPDFRIDSEHVVPNEQFFPCKVRIAWSTSIGGLRQGVVAVREIPGRDLSKTIDAMAPVLFEAIGSAYAHAFRFPAAYGPDFYLSAVGAVLPGESSIAHSSYNKRLSQWRDRTWHEHKRPSQGYLREVYPINFLKREQLKAKVDGIPLLDYMKSVGNVQESRYGDGLYRWDVSDCRLEDVRKELEKTGVVLSSSAA